VAVECEKASKSPGPLDAALLWRQSRQSGKSGDKSPHSKFLSPVRKVFWSRDQMDRGRSASSVSRPGCVCINLVAFGSARFCQQVCRSKITPGEFRVARSK